MANTQMKLNVNCDTGTSEYVAMTAAEIAAEAEFAAAHQARMSEKAAAEQALDELKSAAKAKLIAGEPLTAEEADTLVI